MASRSGFSRWDRLRTLQNRCEPSFFSSTTSNMSRHRVVYLHTRLHLVSMYTYIYIYIYTHAYVCLLYNYGMQMIACPFVLSYYTLHYIVAHVWFQSVPYGSVGCHRRGRFWCTIGHVLVWRCIHVGGITRIPGICLLQDDLRPPVFYAP